MHSRVVRLQKIKFLGDLQYNSFGGVHFLKVEIMFDP